MQQPTEIKLVPFHLARDLPLLERWLARPHVRRWWGDPETNLAEARHLPPGADHALIAAGTTPVGYLRWQRVSPQDLADVGLDDIPEGAVDIDIFIGEPAYLGRGVGPRALQLLVARLRADSTVPLAGLCTDVHNTAAVRAYEKAGFTRMRQYEDPESGPCWIMVLPLRNPAA